MIGAIIWRVDLQQTKLGGVFVTATLAGVGKQGASIGGDLGAFKSSHGHVAMFQSGLQGNLELVSRKGGWSSRTVHFQLFGRRDVEWGGGDNRGPVSIRGKLGALLWRLVAHYVEVYR
jgi:hypothetical protein